MAKFTFNKLVRDNFLPIYKKLGQNPDYIFLDQTQHKKALIKKLREEVNELDHGDAKLVEELADISQLVDDILKFNEIPPAELNKIKQRKFKEKGGFLKGLYIKNIELKDNDKWADYYRSNPKKYKEIK